MENEYKGYKVNSLGIIYNKRFKKESKCSLDKNGYKVINIYFNGLRKTERVNRIIAKTFIPNPNNKPFVNHINGIKTDNRVENLEWVTAKENTEHAIKNKLFNPVGSNNKRSKLNEIDVLNIRNETKNIKRYNRKKLAQKYNVSESIIKRIVINQTWKHVINDVPKVSVKYASDSLTVKY
jgi:hypothetical protein